MSTKPHVVATNNNMAASQPMGLNGSSTPSAGPQQGFDIWGPLQRRKYLVALFCLIGAGLGYLYFTKSPKVFSSSTELMISTQAPPTVVDGSFKNDKVSLMKHSSLLASELVMRNAVEKGELASLETFRENPNPGAIIKSLQNGMIEIVSEFDDDETLTVICSGPVPDDLPIILNQISEAYKHIIQDESKTIGEETAALVQELADSLKIEKDDAETEWLRLREKLGIQSFDEDGNGANPFNKRLFYLQDQQAELASKQQELLERMSSLSKSLEVDEATGIIDPVMIKVAALEAKEYLNLVPNEFQFAQQRSRVASLQSELSKLSVLEGRVWTLETKITELKFERAKRSEVFAKGHKSIVALDEQIGVFENKQADFNREIAELEKYIAERSPDEEIDPTTGQESDDIANEESFREQERREWITLYQKFLQQEEARLSALLKGVNDEFVIVKGNAAEISSGIVKLNMLQRKIDKKDAAVNSIVDQIASMNILATSSSYSKTKVRVLDEPKRGIQIAPSLVKSIGAGTMLAFLAGLGLAVLIDQSELSYRSPHEILERLKVPVVGRIPRINTRNVDAKIGHASLIAAHKPSSTASESFRDVRTGLFFRSNLEDIKTVLFSSPSPGDGKSTTIANMAISIAQAGKRVILVDADFRRPRVHQYFDEEIKPGLLDVLSGEMNLRDTIRPSKLQDNLYLLTSGGRPANPGELVTSEAFRELIGALRERFDYVLIDSPPVLPVSDPATIASMVDAVYLVTRIRKGVKLTAQKAKDTLDSVGANWMGIIVNGIDENPHYSEYGYQYGNYSYYGGMYGKYYDSHNKAYREKITVNAELKT